MEKITIEGSHTPSVILARGERRTVVRTPRIDRLIARGYLVVVDEQSRPAQSTPGRTLSEVLADPEPAPRTPSEPAPAPGPVQGELFSVTDLNSSEPAPKLDDDLTPRGPGVPPRNASRDAWAGFAKTWDDIGEVPASVLPSGPDQQATRDELIAAWDWLVDNRRG